MSSFRSSGSFAGAGVAGRRGQVLVILLLSMAVLVGLVLFVFNLGDQVNRRLELQNAADSAAISGAGWMARAMNTIAMNNVAQSRMIALVPILDALPLAIEMTLEDVLAWEKMLDPLARQVQNSPRILNLQERAMLTEAIANLQTVYDSGAGLANVSKTDLLNDAHSALTEKFMKGITHWPDGELWQAAIALGDISLAAAESAAELAQLNATEFALASGAESAFLLPASSSFPYLEGDFDSFAPVLIGHVTTDTDDDDLPLPKTAEFESPVSDWKSLGQYYRYSWPRNHPIGGAIPEQGDGEVEAHRLGPFFKLFGWRNEVYDLSDSERTSSTLGVDSDQDSGSSPVNSARQGGSITHSWDPEPELIGYESYGPYSWALTHIMGLTELWDTNFKRHIRDVAEIKLGYMFDGGPLESVHFPEWITDYDEAKRIGQVEPTRVKETRVIRIRIISSVQRDSANWLGEKTVTDPATGQDITVRTFTSSHLNPEIRWWKRWKDPATFGGSRLGTLPIWEKEYQSIYGGKVPNIGLYDNGPHTLYRLDLWLFIGADVGEDVEVSDPSKGRGPGDGPRPILLDTSDGDYETDDAGRSNADEGVRRELFTYLGVAGKANKTRASVKPAPFDPASPHEKMVAVAQASVFNNESWDLWTQTWQARLVPVTKFGPAGYENTWKSAMSDALAGGRASIDLAPFAEFFTAISDEMADMYFNH